MNSEYLDRIDAEGDIPIEIEYEATLERLGGSQELFKHMIVMFEEDIPGLIGSFRTALDQNDSVEATRHIHSIKGFVCGFGAPAMVKFTEHLEATCQAGKLNKVEPHLPQVERGLEEMMRVLGEYRDR